MIEKDGKIIIKKSIKGNLLYCLGSLAFVVCGILILMSHSVFLYYKTLVFFGIIFFSFCFLFLLYRAIIGKDLVVVDRNGITDNTSVIAFGLIPWDDIKDLEIRDMGANQRVIGIVLNDEAKYIEKCSSYKKNIINYNIEHGYGLVNISLNTSGVSIDEFYSKLVQYKNNLR